MGRVTRKHPAAPGYLLPVKQQHRKPKRANLHSVRRTSRQAYFCLEIIFPLRPPPFLFRARPQLTGTRLPRERRRSSASKRRSGSPRREELSSARRLLKRLNFPHCLADVQEGLLPCCYLPFLASHSCLSTSSRSHRN